MSEEITECDVCLTLYTSAVSVSVIYFQLTDHWSHCRQNGQNGENLRIYTNSWIHYIAYHLGAYQEIIYQSFYVFV